jgi:predicted ArsR family transcriptional regulator
MITEQQATENVRILAERMAMLYYEFVSKLIEELGEERAEEVVERVIADYGVACGKLARSAVINAGERPVLACHHLSRELPEFGWQAESELSLDGKQKISRITDCPFAELWKKLGFERWGRLYCHIDQAKMASYNEKIQAAHDKNMLDGDEYCVIRMWEQD